jgi:hypothetical protein
MTYRLGTLHDADWYGEVRQTPPSFWEEGETAILDDSASSRSGREVLSLSGESSEALAAPHVFRPRAIFPGLIASPPPNLLVHPVLAYRSLPG